jgi:hypothetical protein
VIGAKPPHLVPAEEREKVVKKKDMYIDIGASSKEEVQETGVRAGDPVIPRADFVALANGKTYLSKAFDDRVGVALVISALQALQDGDHPNSVYGAATVMEEVGLRGATTSVRAIDPDVAIILESDIAGDVPGIKAEESSVKLGKGPTMLLYDARMIPNLKLRDLLMDTAEQEGIPLQVSYVEGGATDGGAIHLRPGSRRRYRPVGGLADVRAQELVQFPNGVMGIAFNLEAGTVGVIIMGEYSEIEEGMQVRSTGRIASVPVGDGLVGRVVNALGQPVDGKGPIKNSPATAHRAHRPRRGAAQGRGYPGPDRHQSHRRDDPIGRGQRELIIGDRQTGKTAIAIDTIINQKGKDLFCIYVAIGQKKAAIARTVPSWSATARWIHHRGDGRGR